jgi:hypothetical protein
LKIFDRNEIGTVLQDGRLTQSNTVGNEKRQIL